MRINTDPLLVTKHSWATENIVATQEALRGCAGFLVFADVAGKAQPLVQACPLLHARRVGTAGHGQHEIDGFLRVPWVGLVGQE